MTNRLAINPCPLDSGEFPPCRRLGFRERAVVLFSVMTRKGTLWSRLSEWKFPRMFTMGRALVRFSYVKHVC